MKSTLDCGFWVAFILAFLVQCAPY